MPRRHLRLCHTLNCEILIQHRRAAVQARENWRALSRYPELRALAKQEAAAALKHERACTQLIEYIDGKRGGLGKLEGDTDPQKGWEDTQLLFRVPEELLQAFRFCLALAESR